MTWEVRLGSCLDPIAGLQSLGDKSVDVVITDPPYDEHTHASARRGHTGYREPESSRGATFSRNRDLGFDAMTPEQMRGTAEQIARVVRRWSLTFCSLEMIADWRREFEVAGLQYIRTCVWHKVNSTPQFTGDRPSVAVEAIVATHPKGRKRWNGGGSHGIYSHPIVLNRGAGEERCHTTQKPLSLMQELVSLFSDPGELVCDPYAGSGTTGVACRALGRRFVGWEISPEYHAIATRRLAGERAVLNDAQPELFGAGS
jgi:DNA modification methylase